MAGDTVITVVGNLTGDPELRFTPNGAAELTLRSHPPRAILIAHRVNGKKARPSFFAHQYGVKPLKTWQKPCVRVCASSHRAV